MDIQMLQPGEQEPATMQTVGKVAIALLQQLEPESRLKQHDLMVAASKEGARKKLVQIMLVQNLSLSNYQTLIQNLRSCIIITTCMT